MKLLLNGGVVQVLSHTAENCSVMYGVAAKISVRLPVSLHSLFPAFHDHADELERTAACRRFLSFAVCSSVADAAVVAAFLLVFFRRLMEDHEAFVSLGEIFEADRHRQVGDGGGRDCLFHTHVVFRVRKHHIVYGVWYERQPSRGRNSQAKHWWARH